MTLIFQRVETQGIAQLSYFIGDSSSRTAAVIDPQPDSEIYLALMRRYRLAITHIFETHIHADFMSGGLALQERLGDAELCVSGEGGAEYGFRARTIHDGERFSFGDAVLTARHTPGHTPEHLSFEARQSKSSEELWGVFSGDSLFVGSAGRPDLLGKEKTEQLVRQLYDTLRGYFCELDDSVIIYPGHGAGSACGADIGERPMSTIGFEKRTNAFLAHDDFKSFKQFVEEGAPPVPHHYPYLKKLNSSGPRAAGSLAPVRPLPPAELRRMCESGEVLQLVDTRQMLAFGGGHIPGALNIGDRPELSVWAGEMLSHEQPLLLVVEDDESLDWVVRQFGHTGFSRFAGYLAGGMRAWQSAGLPLASLPNISVQELAERLGTIQVLDVRTKREFDEGHIPTSVHYYTADLREGVEREDLPLSPDEPIAVFCGSGYRASIAASILKRAGFRDVHNVPGSWNAWQSADLPVE